MNKKPATPAKLRDGSWGARILGAVEVGDCITGQGEIQKVVDEWCEKQGIEWCEKQGIISYDIDYKKVVRVPVEND